MKKMLLIIFFGLIFTFVLLLVIVPMAINTAPLKQRVHNYLETALNREVKINGDMEIRLLPWVGFTIQNVTIENLLEFSETKQPLMTFEAAEVHLKILPLFMKQIILSDIFVIEPILRLSRNKEAKTNFHDLWYGSGKNQNKFSVITGRIHVRQGLVTYNDYKSGTALVFENISYDKTQILKHTFKTIFDMKIGSIQDNCKKAFKMSVDTYGSATYDSRIWQLDDAYAEIEFKTVAGLEGKFKGHMTYDLYMGNIWIHDMVSQIASTEIKGKSLLINIYMNPEITVDWELDTKKIQDTLRSFSIKPKIEGACAARVSLHTKGWEKDALLENILGNATINFTDGRLITDKTINFSRFNTILALKKRNDVTQNIRGFDLSTEFVPLDSQWATQLVLIGALEFSLKSNRFFTKNMILEARLPNSEKPMTLSATLSANTDTSSISLDNMRITVHDTDITSDLHMIFKDTIEADSNFKFSETNVSEVFAYYGYNNIPIKKAYGQMRIKIKNKNLYIDDMDLVSDETKFVGNIKVSDIFDNPYVNCQINANNLDLNRFIESFSIAKHDGQKSTENNSNENKSNESKSNDLRNIKLSGSIGINRLKVGNIVLDDVKTNMSIMDGVIYSDPITGVFYDGAFSGRFQTDSRDMFETTLSLDLSDMSAEKFLKDAAGKSVMAGKTQIKGWVSSKGYDLPMVLQNLNGECDFMVQNGKFPELEIVPWIARFSSNAFDLRNQTEQMPDSHSFSKMSAHFQIKKGKIITNDFQLTAKPLEAKGKGVINLNNLTCVSQLYVDIPGIPIIPISVSGPLSNINHSVNKGELMQETVSSLINGATSIGTQTFKIGTQTFEIGKDAFEMGAKTLDINKSNIKKGTDALKKTFDKSSESIKNTFDKSVDVGKGAIETMKEGIKDLFNQSQKTEKNEQPKPQE